MRIIAGGINHVNDERALGSDEEQVKWLLGETRKLIGNTLPLSAVSAKSNWKYI